MTRLRMPLTAAILSVACVASTTGALAAADASTALPRLGPRATIARTGKGQRKHSRAACESKRRHQAKRKHPAKHSHSKHSHRCLARTIHAKRSHRSPSHGRLPSGQTTAPKSPRELHAQPASNHPPQPQATTTVTVRPSPAETIASVLATPCQNTELMPAAANLEQVEQATVCLVNQERARNDELPLQLNAQLAEAATGHSADMVDEDYFAHIAPDGETPLERVHSTGYIPNSQVGYTLGENIAWGTLSLATPSAIVAAWIASPEHLANILDPAYKETAVGVAPAAPASLAEGQPGAMYTQEFGVIEG